MPYRHANKMACQWHTIGMPILRHANQWHAMPWNFVRNSFNFPTHFLQSKWFCIYVDWNDFINLWNLTWWCNICKQKQENIIKESPEEYCFQKQQVSWSSNEAKGFRKNIQQEWSENLWQAVRFHFKRKTLRVCIIK